MPENITAREQERRRRAIADARHSSEMEGGRSNDAARADQDAYARGDLTIDELIERATTHTQR